VSARFRGDPAFGGSTSLTTLSLSKGGIVVLTDFSQALEFTPLKRLGTTGKKKNFHPFGKNVISRLI
jgi:hypothetical protein